QIQDDLRFCLLLAWHVAHRWLGGKPQMHRPAATGRDSANREPAFETVSLVALWKGCQELACVSVQFKNHVFSPMPRSRPHHRATFASFISSRRARTALMIF